jgi:selenide,water dikinase
LEEILQALPRQSHPDLLVGMETADDAGVYRLTPEMALIQTVDFFTPVVNDPYTFGQIAAANALSDVYAMGGRPLTALNIVCYPARTVPREVLQAILAGGLDKIHEAGALLVGGHSVDDTELKYGLAVTGLVHPERVLTNAGAQVGDELMLTKPLGTGVIATAMKGRQASPEASAAAIDVMKALNRLPGECLESGGVHAVTDITGFGLLGHALEMAVASKVEITFYTQSIPLLPAAREYAAMGLMPGGSFANRNFCAASLQVAPGLDPVLVDLCSDAQTNGGLLLAVSPEQRQHVMDCFQAQSISAWGIGKVTGEAPGRIKLEP